MSGRPTCCLLPLVAILEDIAAAWQARQAFGPVGGRFDPKAIADLVRRGLPFLLMGLLSVVQLRIGFILLAVLSGNVAVGTYTAADRLMLPVILVQNLLIYAAQPLMLQLWTSDRQRMLEVASRCLRVVLLFSIPVAGLVFALRRDLLTIVFGAQFGASVAPLAVLAWLPVASGASFLWNSQAVAANLDRQATAINAVVVVLLAVAAVLLIRLSGPAGLAIAVVGAEIIRAALLWGLLVRHNMTPRTAKYALGPSCAVVTAIACSVAVSEYSFLWRTLTITIVMLVGLWLFGGVRLHDLRFALASLQGRGDRRPETPKWE